MSSISYLPHVAPKNNNTQQIRRRVNDLVTTVNQNIGSIAGQDGDIGQLSTEIAALPDTFAPINNPTFTGTVTQPDSSVLTAATTSATATTGPTIVLPAHPEGYLVISINGSSFRVPYYNP